MLFDFLTDCRIARSLVFSLLFLSVISDAKAEEARSFKGYKTESSAPRHYTPSTTETGIIGINTIPSARMDPQGTIRIGAGTSDPYIHGFIGFQLADPFYVSLRQTYEVSGLTASPDALYPGIDFKLRLAEETATRPAIALGMDSAIGDKRMASEYLTFSKRFSNFDVTGGVAWGRLGSAGHIKNPLGRLSSHFNKPRQYNSLFNGLFSSQDPSDWFTGEDIGFFGGVEYFTPIKNLSLKADYGANDYIGESIINGFNAPDPWAISLNYSPLEQANLSVGVIGGEKIMARLSLQDQLYDWPGKSSNLKKSQDLIAPRPVLPTAETLINETTLSLSAHAPTGRQIGQISRVLANNTDPQAETLTVSLRHKGLKGPVVTLLRSVLERALLNHQGSVEEIWQGATIAQDDTPFIDLDAIKDSLRPKKVKYLPALKFILEQKFNLSESITSSVYRTSGIIEAEKRLPFGMIGGAAARIDIANNLHLLQNDILRPEKPVRNDEDLFAGQRLSVDRLYTTWLKSLTPSTHISVNTGYLEEMFGGYGGEILYRPYGKTFAIGAEGWAAYKRDPYASLNMKLYKDKVFTGHLNLFYEMPNKNITSYLKVGRYLGEDIGGTFGIKSNFDNGSSLEGFITATNQTDRDILGNKTHMYGGVRFNLPLGNIPFVPNGSEVRVSVGPMARDNGQTLNKPQPLYELTEPIASRHLTQSWSHLLD